MSPLTSGGTRSMVISCPHTDALFVIQCFNHCCCRRQKHLAWESHSTICWVTSKEFHLLRKKHTLFSRQQVKISKYINYVNQTLLLYWKKPQNPWQISETLTWICCPTSNPSAVGCLIWNLIYNMLLFFKFATWHAVSVIVPSRLLHRCSLTYPLVVQLRIVQQYRSHVRIKLYHHSDIPVGDKAACHLIINLH